MTWLPKQVTHSSTSRKKEKHFLQTFFQSFFPSLLPTFFDRFFTTFLPPFLQTFPRPFYQTFFRTLLSHLFDLGNDFRRVNWRGWPTEKSFFSISVIWRLRGFSTSDSTVSLIVPVFIDRFRPCLELWADRKWLFLLWDVTTLRSANATLLYPTPNTWVWHWGNYMCPVMSPVLTGEELQSRARTHTLTHFTHNRWWLVLGWVTTKKENPRPPTNSLHKLHMARYQVLLTYLLTY